MEKELKKNCFILKSVNAQKQEISNNNSYLTSSISFDMHVDGKDYKNLTAQIKQVVGSNFDDNDSLEVVYQFDYPNQFNYKLFRDSVEDYYKELIGPNGRAIKINKIDKNTLITLIGNTFLYSKKIEW